MATLVLLVAIALLSSAHAGTLCLGHGLCLTDSTPEVIDGDTFALDGQRFRLWGIDAPEMDQPHGPESRECLRTVLLYNSVLAWRPVSTSYGRQVVQVYGVDVAFSVHPPAERVMARGTPELLLSDVALGLLWRGCAWYVPPYAPFQFAYAEGHQEAQEAKRGLWALEEPIEPAVWRQRKKEKE